MRKPTPASRIGVKRRRTAPLRVNARLDHGYAAKLRVLIEHRGVGVTEALKYAIDLGYREATARTTRPVLDALVGAFEGPADLSTDYKERLSESLARKRTPRRTSPAR